MRDQFVLASHQPDFFPWMGYFYKIYQSDIFVFSDNVQYSKSGRHNYNLILTKNGPLRITIPIHYHAVNLNEIKLAIDEQKASTILKTLSMEYKKAPHYEEAFPVIEEIIKGSLKQESLASFNYDCIMKFCRLFGLEDEGREFYISSNLDLKYRRDERIIEMCELLHAEAYFSGTAAKAYHIEENYAKKGIALIYSDYEPIVYPQVGNPPSINMCSIDYVMNCGFNLPKEWKRIEPTYIRHIYPELQESENM